MGLIRGLFRLQVLENDPRHGPDDPQVSSQSDIADDIIYVIKTDIRYLIKLINKFSR